MVTVLVASICKAQENADTISSEQVVREKTIDLLICSQAT